MKLISSITLTLLASTFTFAQTTTMCFKENHNSMSTIEKTILDGGECKGKFTLNDMKEQGYQVDDIKITTLTNGNYNFLYILKNKTSENINNTFSEKELEKRILQRLEVKKEKEKKEKEENRKTQMIIDGKKLYVNKCQTCHGKNGEKTPYNVGSPLKDLSENDIAFAINSYSTDSSYGHGYNLVMLPIADSTTTEHVEKIKAYLDSINK